MVACACEEGDAGWCVGFVGFEIEVDAYREDRDEAREVDVEVVGLGTI